MLKPRARHYNSKPSSGWHAQQDITREWRRITPFAGPSCGRWASPSQSRRCPALCHLSQTPHRTLQTRSGRGWPAAAQTRRSEWIDQAARDAVMKPNDGLHSGRPQGAALGSSSIRCCAAPAALGDPQQQASQPARQTVPCAACLPRFPVHGSDQVVCDAMHLQQAGRKSCSWTSASAGR